MRVISSDIITTRKEHNCWGCTTELPKGSRVRRTVTEDGGQIGTAYWCGRCDKILVSIDPDDGICYGDLKGHLVPD